ncbi:hypothetical protein WN59_02405 [Salinicoccus sediminis]|uniref:Uncharacterized protein n=1 Tax=Salinicoccus sediminis TaxID=1432562 RepID=A0A0M2SPT7_9STAP|nr:hypothetical protein [Salinicoccus sediminis]KKK35696.1 hypothetical protein WN59_02405 [Salinicoccus sediminis]
MVINWLDYKLDGNRWETLCLDICRIIYKEEYFHEVPAHYKGDGGIEGFTKSKLGVVIQCYCPDDPNLDHNKLYESQRDKVTKDIQKIIDNHGILKKIGVAKITRWIFMVPEYKDKRILEHCQNKQRMILKAKENNPKDLEYISEDFQVHIKVAADFKTEIARLIRTEITDVKLDIPELEEESINWETLDSEKSKNVSRKMKAISSTTEENPERSRKLIDYHIKRYIFGKTTLEKLSNEYPDIWNDVMKIERVFKNKVKEKTLLSYNHEMNLKTYNALSDEFEESLNVELKYLTTETSMMLAQSIISSWLADCHMEFY